MSLFCSPPCADQRLQGPDQHIHSPAKLPDLDVLVRGVIQGRIAWPVGHDGAAHQARICRCKAVTSASGGRRSPMLISTLSSNPLPKV